MLGWACSKGEEPAAEASPPRTVHVTATDFAFQAPDTLPAGLTSFHLMNTGKELHHLFILRLAEGQSLADLGPAGPPPGSVAVGGPNVAPPDGTAEAIVELQPGRYALLCVIPSADGHPHVAKGMVKELIVSAGETVQQAPATTLTLKLTDYDFELSGPLTAGRHVVRVENVAAQPHELVVVKLEPGKTVQQMAEWLETMQGPPPGSPLGFGVSPLHPGQWNIVTMELTPGEYGFLCFLPDAGDRRPHILHGMLKQVTVM
jgi:uncharacterized cupredoxin-like copper-binding protein